MEKHDIDIELPPLPDWMGEFQIPSDDWSDDGFSWLDDRMRDYARATVEPYAKRIAELEASRIAYASGFAPDENGNPDVGSIHENIRKLKADRKKFGRNDNDNRKRRGEPVGYIPLSDERIRLIWKETRARMGDGGDPVLWFARAIERAHGISAPQPLSESDIPDEPDLVRCAECGAEMIQVRPGKWQHPDCSQSSWAAEPVLDKYQPCGCVICTCEDDVQCQGCGARHCGKHPIGEISDPVYVSAEPVEGLSAGQLAEILSAYIKPEIIGEALEKLENAPWELSHPVKVDAKASVPSDDALYDALSNLEHDNYEQSYSGYKNRQADIALIRAALARHG